MSEIKDSTRIRIDMSTHEALCALTEGNPGALRVCMEMMQASPSVDPQSALGGLAPLLSLDQDGIYGSRIWMLYKDVCGEEIVPCLALLRAVQLGLLGRAALSFAIDNRGDGLDLDEIHRAVCKQLDQFAKPADPASDAELEAAS